MANQANPVRLPDDNSSIHDIGNFIMSYEPYQNAFCNALVNRISKVLVTSRIWENPWAVFKKGTLELGETVEEIFVNIAKPHSFDPSTAEAELYKREMPDVRAAFHTMNYQKMYKVTVSQQQLRQAFVSFSELESLVSNIVETLYTSMNLDEWLTTKYMLARECLNGGVYTVVTSPIEGDGADPADAIKKYREYTNNLKLLKTIYNRAGVRTSTPVADQIIIMPNKAESILGVDVLASAFNINQVDYISERVSVDYFYFDADDEARLAELFANDSTYKPFTTAEKEALAAINAVKLDRRWFMIFDNLNEMRNIENGQGLYWNYMLHAWRTFSASPYANALVFTSQASSITKVTVSPATANATQGSSLQMLAAVTGTGLYDKAVTWTIKSDKELKAATNIDGGTGALHIAADETVGTAITVTATAKDGKTGTATITVTAA